jgi:dTDP-4-amino-4,6-dideoxygalactose transaminase/predicted dehydrogenase
MAGCPVVDGLEGLLRQGVQAVSVAVPTQMHTEVALACIARGVHLLVEKPISATIAEGQAIVAAARRAGVTLMVGHVERFNPAVRVVKQAIEGEEILSIAITRVGPFPPRMSSLGVVTDLAVHDIDLVRWLTNSEIVEVQSQLSSAIAEREDIALLQFRTASGVLAHINTNWLTPFKARTLHVATRRKYVMADLLTRQVTECFGFQADGRYSMRHLAVDTTEPLRAELGAFLESVRAGTPPAVSGEEGVASLEIAMRCLNGTHSLETAAAPATPAGDAIRFDRGSVASDAPGGVEADSVSFAGIEAQRRALGGGIDAAIGRVLSHCRFVMGPEVSGLEAELARFCGVRHALTTSSGTDALRLVLMARGIGPGDAVLCPAFTYCATAEVVALAGATPIFTDVDADTFNMDPAGMAAALAAAKRLGLKAKAVIPVDLFGLPADYDGIAAIAGREGLFVLGDGAQSFGAASGGRRVGALAAATATSFYPSKPFGGYGDGGAVLTEDAELAAVVGRLRTHGRDPDTDEHTELGLTGRLDTIQAAVLIEKLRIFPREIEARQRAADRYGDALHGVAVVPRVPRGRSPVWAQYAVRVPPAIRDEVVAKLRAEGIPTAVHYRTPLHRQPAYRRFPVADGGVPVSERLAGEVICLPMHAYLDARTQDRIIQAVRRALGR